MPRCRRRRVGAIRSADLVVVGPSNPLSSIGPIVALPGVREAIASARAVAVTPVVSRVEIGDEGERRRARSRAAQLGSIGLDNAAHSVAWLHRDIVGTFVLDDADHHESGRIREMGLEVVAAPTIVNDDCSGDRLAEIVCEIGTRAGPRPRAEASRP
jgi:LPPG:FO 2-phospho-L-lactate transferase